MDLNQLNSAQREAVLATEGPVMILAGAGSGKTRTLVAKMAYLLSDLKISPFQILALTFSNKAAREMRDRISSEGKVQSGALQVSTFHAFCAQILRSEYSYLGLGRNFTIYDQSESKSIVKSLLGQKGISIRELSPLNILFYIQELKNQGYYSGRKDKEKVTSFSTVTFREMEKDDFYSYFQEYERELNRSNAVDFGGLLTGVLELFEKFPDVLERYQSRFKYILVDEYQDTNRAQFDLVLNLCQKRRNLCVVGDEDQSIYSWRGADIRNILEFNQVFPEAKIIKLEQNYRSSKKIIEAASCVVARNVNRSGKTMWTENPEGDAIEIRECHNDKTEGAFLATEVKKLVREGNSLKDMAVFYRNNSQSRVLEDCLRKENVPYRVIGGIRFYERKEIKDMLSYLRLVVNNRDSLSLGRTINVPPRGIGVGTLRKLEGEAIARQTSLWEAIAETLENGLLKVSGKIKSSLNEYVTLISEMMVWNAEKVPPFQIYEKILQESGYLEYLKAHKDYESLSRIDNLEELGHAIKQYEQSENSPTLGGFLETITLDSYFEENEEKDQGELSLMTVHSSKGLEFPYVFLVGAEENIFPSYKSIEAAEMGLEEERRLFYVAMTRAMKKLYICFSQARMFHGNLVFNGPSRFIDEIPESFFRWTKVEKDYSWDYNDQRVDEREEEGDRERGPYRPTLRSGKSERNRGTYPSGSKIVHSLYGEGLVLETDGAGNEEKVLVAFSGGVKKKFMVKYAPISLLEGR